MKKLNLSLLILAMGLNALASDNDNGAKRYVVSSVTGEWRYCINYELAGPANIFGVVGETLSISMKKSGVFISGEDPETENASFLTGTHIQHLLGAGDLILVGNYASEDAFELDASGGSGSSYTIKINRSGAGLTFDSLVPNPDADTHCVLTPASN